MRSGFFLNEPRRREGHEARQEKGRERIQKSNIINYLHARYLNVRFFQYFSPFFSVSSAPSAVHKKVTVGCAGQRTLLLSLCSYLALNCNQAGVCCNSGRSSGTIAFSTGHTCKQMPQSMQVSKSIQNQSVPLTFLPGPG